MFWEEGKTSGNKETFNIKQRKEDIQKKKEKEGAKKKKKEKKTEK